MSAVFDDFLGTLCRALSTEVGNTLFGDEDVHIMLCLVVVRHHRYDGTDFAFLGYGRTREDGDEGITGKVARTSYPVHHLGTGDVGRVYVTINVGFDGGIHGDDTQSAYYGRVVGDFRRTDDELVLEEFKVIVDALQTLVGHTERAGTTELHTAGTNQVHHRFLQHFGVHFEIGHIRIASQGTEYGIGNVAHATL